MMLLNPFNILFVTHREKRVSTQKMKEEEQAQKELEHMLLLQRRRAMRGLRKKQLESLDILPAGKMVTLKQTCIDCNAIFFVFSVCKRLLLLLAEVAKYLAKESSEAATKIQARWRGHHVRQTVYLRKDMVTQVKAVITMQRSVRHTFKT